MISMTGSMRELARRRRKNRSPRSNAEGDISCRMTPQSNEAPDGKPTLSFEHTELGSFVATGDIWTTQIPHGKDTLELSLAGTASAPYQALTTAASALLARFSEVEQSALTFLTSQPESPSREDFICEGVELLREDYPNHFSLSFMLFGDTGGVWRVEFEDGEPLFLARDDATPFDSQPEEG